MSRYEVDREQAGEGRGCMEQLWLEGAAPTSDVSGTVEGSVELQEHLQSWSLKN